MGLAPIAERIANRIAQRIAERLADQLARRSAERGFDAKCRREIFAAVCCVQDPALEGRAVRLGGRISETFEPQAGEAATLEDCNRRTCTMLREKNPRGEDLQCNITKTWPQATIKRADTLVLRWKFGDARCSVQLHVRRADIVGALTQPEYKLEVPAHTADCLIEDAGQLRTISATLSPRIVFQKGKAEKIWVNLIRADGGARITKFLWAAAKLEDTTGLFHSAMVKAVNRYIYDQCPAKYPRAMVSPKR
jgi:hypothetical protein